MSQAEHPCRWGFVLKAHSRQSSRHSHKVERIRAKAVRYSYQKQESRYFALRTQQVGYNVAARLLEREPTKPLYTQLPSIIFPQYPRYIRMTWKEAVEIGDTLNIDPYEVMASGKEEDGALIILAVLALALIMNAIIKR